MKRTLTIFLLALTMTACGGGGSETNDAATPPAPDAPQNPGNGGNGGGGNGAEEPAPETELSLSCSPTPKSGFVAPGGKATATFNFSQTYNGAGSLIYGKNGEMANEENTFINGNQVVVTRTVGDEGKYSIRLNVKGTDLTAVCTWTIGFELILVNP
jgi:hypothetical protein